jgi:hypothetical protein
MKIKGFSGKHSTEDTIALVTEPLSDDVVSHFLPLYQSRPELAAVPLTFEGGLIFLHTSHLPNGFIDFMESLLTQAEGMIAHEQNFAREEEDVEENAKQEALRKIAESQGRPIL